MIKDVRVHSLLFIFIMALSACNFVGAKKEAPGFVIVNVLDQKYHDDCHIKGSINVPFDQIEDYAEKNWGKDTQIVLYCSNYKCTASGAGARALREKGYKNVWAYEGGTAEWLQRGLPTEGPCEAPFLSDYKMPEGFDAEDDIIITAEALQKKIEKFGVKK